MTDLVNKKLTDKHTRLVDTLVALVAVSLKLLEKRVMQRASLEE